MKKPAFAGFFMRIDALAYQPMPAMLEAPTRSISQVG